MYSINNFPGELGSAGVYWSKGWWRWWWQLDYWSYKSCKAPVKSSPPTNQQPVFLQAGCPSCHPTNSVKAPKGKISYSMDLLTPSSPGVLQLCLTTNSSWLPWGGGCHASHQPSDASTPWCQYRRAQQRLQFQLYVLLQISDHKLIYNWMTKTDQKLTCPAVELETDVKFSAVINSQVIVMNHCNYCVFLLYIVVYLIVLLRWSTSTSQSRLFPTSCNIEIAMFVIGF